LNCAVDPRPAEQGRRHSFAVAYRFASQGLRKSQVIVNKYETLKPQKETVAAVMPHRVFHPSPCKNLSSLF